MADDLTIRPPLPCGQYLDLGVGDAITLPPGTQLVEITVVGSARECLIVAPASDAPIPFPIV